MLFWLVQLLAPVWERLEIYSAGDSRVYLTARTALSSVTAFLLAMAGGPAAIRWLKSRFRERIDSASDKLNELQASKKSTPTMGGLFIIGAVIVSTLLSIVTLTVLISILR